jgi:hypothetical protein
LTFADRVITPRMPHSFIHLLRLMWLQQARGRAQHPRV